MTHPSDLVELRERQEFGHESLIIPGVLCLDSWGVGPFLIKDERGKPYLFEDSDRFGPLLVTLRRGNVAERQPGERSKFWRAHRIWVRQGRRVADDGKTCIWHEPKPTYYEKRGRATFIVENGEEDGHFIERPAALTALSQLTGE